MCPDEVNFPQKIYDPSTFPWKKILRQRQRRRLLPADRPNVADSAVADFNNDGTMDLFMLSGVQTRPSSVVQEGPYKIEALLAGGSKGFHFVSTGTVTFTINWNKASEGVGTDLTKIQIGAKGNHPSAGNLHARSVRCRRVAACPRPRPAPAAAADADRLQHDDQQRGR